MRKAGVDADQLFAEFDHSRLGDALQGRVAAVPAGCAPRPPGVPGAEWGACHAKRFCSGANGLNCWIVMSSPNAIGAMLWFRPLDILRSRRICQSFKCRIMPTPSTW